jgi:hypothetical protein
MMMLSSSSFTVSDSNHHKMMETGSGIPPHLRASSPSEIQQVKRVRQTADSRHMQHAAQQTDRQQHLRAGGSSRIQISRP